MSVRHRQFLRTLSVAGALLGVLALTGCGGGSDAAASGGVTQDGGAWTWALPAGFPTPAVPASNPMSTSKVDLGRHLFYDKRLSGNGQQACAGCHLPDKAFTDGAAVSRGSTGEFTARNAQPLGNVAYNPLLTWANPSLLVLERQMEVPLFGENPIEMGINEGNKAAVLQRLAGTALYKDKFAAAFPGEADPVSWLNVIKAIAAFQRSLISGNSRYDQKNAGTAVFTPSEQRGRELFFGDKARCSRCHNGFNFNDQAVHADTAAFSTPFHNIGLYNVGGTGAYPEPNRGVMELSGLFRDMGSFRAPSLRNVAVTAPYMHDGSVATLEEVVEIFAEGGRNVTTGPYAGDGRLNPYKSPLISPLGLTAQDKADLVAFLKTLTDTGFLSDPRHADPFKAP
ncbi:MAG: di-heme enzyme [Burkholderiaceae bacterium]|nr:di-heme enzyme [Burkholderiaceae bacterium]